MQARVGVQLSRQQQLLCLPGKQALAAMAGIAGPAAAARGQPSPCHHLASAKCRADPAYMSLQGVEEGRTKGGGGGGGGSVV